ncbi:hypothetical protein F5883DRAFT_112610 [Diaporthe sp. PMI_573]|nr:hypothetical protein F5883DRAFT_112610 [Diaporthaceae sp. PMI_573]
MATQNDCRACFAKFNSPAELRSHIELFQAIYFGAWGDDETWPEADRNPCPVCGEHFKLQTELDKHIWAHQSEVSKLSDGIKAAVWHLPALDHGFDDNSVHDEHGEGPHHCPYPQCNAGAPRKVLLTQHYASRNMRYLPQAVQSSIEIHHTREKLQPRPREGRDKNLFRKASGIIALYACWGPGG